MTPHDALLTIVARRWWTCCTPAARPSRRRRCVRSWRRCTRRRPTSYSASDSARSSAAARRPASRSSTTHSTSPPSSSRSTVYRGSVVQACGRCCSNDRLASISVDRRLVSAKRLIMILKYLLLGKKISFFSHHMLLHKVAMVDISISLVE